MDSAPQSPTTSNSSLFVGEDDHTKTHTYRISLNKCPGAYLKKQNFGQKGGHLFREGHLLIFFFP